MTRASDLTVVRGAGVRPALAVLALCVSGLGGCGKPPEATFVSSKRTQALIRPVQKLVDQAIGNQFGTPQNLVASLRLPVEYGVWEGVVKKDGGANSNHFTATWTGPETEEALKSIDLSGAGFLWETGANVDAKIIRQKREYPAEIQVLYHHPEDGQIGLSMNFEDVEAGDKFRIVGNVLQSGRKLYMQHCMHCHGVSGDGNGPTSRYLNPLPRDYRLGIFKFTSTTARDKVTRSDLHRVIRNGIPGTYMPSFLLLKQNELHAITEYVRWLTLRGEFEKRLVDGVYGEYSTKAVEDRVKGGEKRPEIERAAAGKEFVAEFDESIENTFVGLHRDWTRAEEPTSLVQPKSPRTDPAADAASIERGRKLYLSDKTKCASCHGPTGRGDGPQTTDVQKRPDGSEYDRPGLFDSWDNTIKPRDLTQGIYRGGRRPIDVYRRVHSGIKGTPMPSFSTALKEEEIWDIVNYVMSVPYHGKAPPSLKAGAVATTASAAED